MVRDFNQLNQYIDILNYSCYHTRANKLRTSIRKLIQKDGKELKISYKINRQTDGEEIEKTIKLDTYLTAKEKYYESVELKKENPNEDLDFLSVRTNGRTVYKYNRYCVICGSTDRIQSRHLRHVRVGKTIGFTQVMNQLNRKTIVVCKACHMKIHKNNTTE